MNTDSAAYRFYAERLIRKIVSRYKDNPNVIGWQVDNETGTYGAANEDVFVRFQHHLEKKFGTPENLSKAWFLNYWGQDLHSWTDLPRPDGAHRAVLVPAASHRTTAGRARAATGRIASS